MKINMHISIILPIPHWRNNRIFLPVFQAEWGINNTEAGWISGVYFAGYIVAVAILTALTDRVSVRGIYLGSMTLSALASGSPLRAARHPRSIAPTSAAPERT